MPWRQIVWTDGQTTRGCNGVQGYYAQNIETIYYEKFKTIFLALKLYYT